MQSLLGACCQHDIGCFYSVFGSRSFCFLIFFSFSFHFFFFFQAEDGIRDHCVTGVQTCALPIWRFPSSSHVRLRSRPSTPTRRPLARYSAQSSAWRSHAFTQTKSAFEPLPGRLTASRKPATFLSSPDRKSVV